jgi:flagellar motor protein MotB
LAEFVPCFTPIDDRSRCASDDRPVLETVLVEGHTDRRPIGKGAGSFRDKTSFRLSARWQFMPSFAKRAPASKN